MKIMIEIECTPQEARSFFGLPEVEGMQAELMGTVAERMREALSASDPEALMRTWMPAGLQGWEQMQKMFWAAARGGDDGEKA
ncbi:MAG: DUF6489 family protein [Alphaproteobacteria bacterium]|jgi:hypothetical protein|nr:DUF6489 family protein [Alphaproteobacteria bacterium]